MMKEKGRSHMTRGKILFIKDNGEISCTTEFNGDMYPSGNGG